MPAGDGSVHSEMPEQDEGLLRGFQLWVNLPTRDKMTAPRYQDIAPEAIPTVHIGAGATAPRRHTAFVYVYEGAARIGSGAGATAVQRGELAVLGSGDRVDLAAAAGPARLLLVRGRAPRAARAPHG